MKFGIAIFPTDRSIGVGELVREGEERGFESFWVPEHTHIPVSRRSPWPGGSELPEHYSRTLDPFVALTVAAEHSSRLLLGFGILLLVERDPIITAKAVASLDLISRGRVIFGIGGGWNLEEMENHGTDPELCRAAPRRATAGDTQDLDPRRGGVPRRPRRLRPDLVVAQAGPGPAADLCRRQHRAHPEAGDRVRRRLDPERRPVAAGRPGPGVPPALRGVRSGTPPRDRLRHPADGRGDRRLRSAGRGPAGLPGAPANAGTRHPRAGAGARPDALKTVERLPDGEHEEGERCNEEHPEGHADPGRHRRVAELAPGLFSDQPLAFRYRTAEQQRGGQRGGGGPRRP